MPRKSTFTVDAEGVQGNAGATATFHCITIGEHREWRESPTTTDADLLRGHLVSWAGMVDDEGQPLPSPDADPTVLDRLYQHEQNALIRLFVAGPEGPSAKN